MSVFSYHLIKTDYFTAFKALMLPPTPLKTKGLIHSECMSAMTLGSPIFSPSRILIRQIVFFAQWETEADIDKFLKEDSFGKLLSKGWHTRLIFMRQWGNISGFDIPKEIPKSEEQDCIVVAITLARMKLLQVPRFINWGRPVEKLVRDHQGTTLSLASIRLPRLVSTFSIWKSQEEMTNMVHGHSSMPKPKRHSDAMKERERKDFHIEFTTLRFKPIFEQGKWNNQSNFIQKLPL